MYKTFPWCYCDTDQRKKIEKSAGWKTVKINGLW